MVKNPGPKVTFSRKHIKHISKKQKNVHLSENKKKLREYPLASARGARGRPRPKTKQPGPGGRSRPKRKRSGPGGRSRPKRKQSGPGGQPRPKTKQNRSNMVKIGPIWSNMHGYWSQKWSTKSQKNIFVPKCPKIDWKLFL